MVRVQALVDGRSAGPGADKGNATGLAKLGLGDTLVALTEVLDGDGLHRELDEVEWEEQMMFQIQTIPIQPPEMSLMSVKPQLAYAAMMEEIT